MNMNTTTKLITLLVLALLPVIANAHDVQIDGIYYVLDDKHATATVCNYTNSMVHIAGTEYVGDIVIHSGGGIGSGNDDARSDGVYERTV